MTPAPASSGLNNRFSFWNNYYLHRLRPFLYVYFIYEILEVVILACLQHQTLDWTPGVALPMLGNLLVETGSSFLYLILPYLLYLLVLPRPFHGGKTDRVLTIVFFTLFCLVNCFEELAEIISADQFTFYSREFLQSPGKAWALFAGTMPVIPMILGILAITAATVAAFFNKLLSRLPAPSAMTRTAMPVFSCALAFVLSLIISTEGISSASREVASDGLFSFFGDLFAVTALPNLPSIFGVPVLVTAIIMFCLLIWERAVRQPYRPSAIGSGMYEHVKTLLRFRSDTTFRLVLFLLAILGFHLIMLGFYPLMDTTEARYAEMSRKMIETGNWLTPQFDYGVPFWGKPPLSFWGSALTMLLAGINEWGARLAPFLVSLIMGGLFLAWPFRTKGRQQATASFIILATSGAGFVASGAVMTDIFLALGIMISMVSFWKSVSQPAANRLWAYLFFIGLAVGLMSKGPLALVLTGFPVIAWTAWNKTWRTVLTEFPWVKGTLLMLALTLPWYLMAEQATPGFLRYFIIGEHFERFIVKGWQGDLYGSGHASPLGTIWLYGLLIFLPWTLLLPLLRKSPAERKEGDASASFLWLWALSPLLFFTVARNILPAYVLPGIPAWAILLTQRLWQWDRIHPGVKNLIFIPAPIMGIMAFFLMGQGFGKVEYRCQKQLLQSWDGQSPLYCWDTARAPYSAQFYSSGSVICLPPGTPVPGGAGTKYLILKLDDYRQHCEQLQNWSQEAEGRNWLLLRHTGH